jgi:hypothetical protein
MKTVKYFLLARGIKILLQFMFVLGIIVLIFDLYIALIHDKPYLKIGDGTIGYQDITLLFTTHN